MQVGKKILTEVFFLDYLHPPMKDYEQGQWKMEEGPIRARIRADASPFASVSIRHLLIDLSLPMAARIMSPC